MQRGLQDIRKAVTMDPSTGGTPGTTSGAPWLRTVTTLLSAVQHKTRRWRQVRGHLDEAPYSVALTLELTWLSKSQREQLEGLVPAGRQLPHNVVEFRSYFPDRMTRSPPEEPLPPPQPPRWHWPTARIVTFALVVLASVSFLLADLAPADYVSGVGERRVIHLEDGSTVTMNTRSRMRVWLTPHARDIDLLNGEALFAVAHDADRPFRVHVGPTVVEAVGTEFSVYRGQHGTKVSVVEGRVKIFAWTDVGASDFQRPPPPVPVSAQEEAHVSTGGGGSAEFDVERRAVTQEQIEHHLAWVNGQLIFEDATLAQTIEEFNRYNRRKLEISDPTLAQIHLGGAFSSTNVDEFIAELNALFRISAVPVGNPNSGAQVIRLQRGPSGPP